MEEWLLRLTQITPVLLCMVLPCAAAALYAALSYQLERRRARLLAQQRDLESAQAAGLTEVDSALRVLRHDLRNHLHTARLLMRDDPARALAYLDELEQRLRCAAVQPHSDASGLFLDAQRKAFSRAGLTLELAQPWSEPDTGSLPCGILLACALDAALGAAKPGSRVEAVPTERGFTVSFAPLPLALAHELRGLRALAGSIGARADMERHGGRVQLAVVTAEPGGTTDE